MANQGQPPTSSRFKPTSQHMTYSPLSYFTSPSSAASNFSFSPPSASYLSLAGATATTPMSSTDDDVDYLSSSSSSTTADDRAQHEPLIATTSRTTRPQKRHHSKPCPVDAVASSATTMATTIAQSTTPIRASTTVTDRGPNTRFKSNSGSSTAIAQGNIGNFPNEGSLLATLATSNTSNTSTPSTHSIAQPQSITSDLIRRVSLSRSVANSATSTPLSLLTSPQYLRPAPTLITTTIAQPKATRPPSSPLQQQLPVFPAYPHSPSSSSHGSPSHQTILPNTTTLPALYSSVAQLEETAEHFSNTGSIETAIREAHQELKRSDSRRSSILAAGVHQAASRRASQTALQAAFVLEGSNPSSATHPADLFSLSRKPSLARSRRDLSRQSSIIGLNSAARAGAFTSNDYIMSPAASVVGASQQRSASKTSSAGDNSSPVLSRHGPGKSSVHSVQSGKQSLAGIVEHELPTAITQDALDEADRRIAAGEEHEDDDTIRASAHQHIGEDNYASSSSPDTDSGLLSTQPLPPMARPTVTDYYGSSSAQQYQPVSTTYKEYSPPGQVNVQGSHQDARPAEIERPTTSGSGGTYKQALSAFDDFDGVHCDPDNASVKHPASAMEHPKARQAPSNPVAHPTSYMDSSTGQQMVFYPARVPAMLKLPPKLSKNPKAAERNARRSQVLGMMAQNNEPKPERESRVWLPDPISGDMGSPLMGSMEAGEGFSASAALDAGSQSTSKVSSAVDQEVVRDAEPGPRMIPTTRGDASQLRRPAQIADSGKRKSRTLSKLPPQLRASAFFDSPSSTANIQLKDGSATATLDSILDASTNAPVSAFTDHAFAGHLGPEVYGVEKRRPKNASDHAKKGGGIHEPAPPHELRTSKSKSSFMSKVGLGHVRKLSEPMDGDARRPRRRLSKNFDATVLSPGLSDGGNLMAPGADEHPSDEDDAEGREGGSEDEGEDKSEGDEDDEDDGLAYDGTPTTLLAELQLRKRQQKLRTRPNIQANPNGMHSTLLELDIVAEIERKARNGKRVNLAWEDPSLRRGDEESDDEDVPLGVLYAARAAGHNDMSAVAAELNRPLGLMEKKEMEDNEPLSRRRDRLQGRNASAGLYLRPSQSTNALRRQNMLTPSTSMMALNKAHSLSPYAMEPEDADRAGDSTPPVEEVDDEPLAARKLRIKAKEESHLPRTRPVSTAFTEELLGQFVDPEEEAAKEQEKKDKLAKANALPSEEEETLGQRRRRLQAEKEAREQEMNGIAGGLSFAFGPGPAVHVDGQAINALDADGAAAATRPTRCFSMADVLSAHPLGSAQTLQNPREVERIRREQETARAALERDQKMAAMRAQMPQSSGNMGAGGPNKSGGFLGGRFNDGSGGISMQTPGAMASTPALYGGMNNMNNRNTIYSGYGGMSQPNLLLPVQQMPVQQMPLMQQSQMQQMQQMRQMQMQQMQMGMAGQMPMQVPGQDRVENWRQSIQP